MVAMTKFANWVNYLTGQVPANIPAWKASSGDAIYVALSNSQPLTTLQTYSTTNITELTAVGSPGYTAGGVLCTCGNTIYSAGTVSFPLTMPTTTWTSNTSTWQPFEYIIFYNGTLTQKPLIGMYDYGTPLTLNGANGDTFAVSLTAGNLFTVT